MKSERPEPAAESPAAASPRLLAGQGLLLGSAAALVAVVPAALRSAQHGAGFLVSWLALAGSVALVAGVVVAAGRIARPFSGLAAAAVLGLLIAAAPLMLFGRVLKATTHHRPLGSATFALVSAAVVLAGMALAARLLTWQGAAPDEVARQKRRTVVAILSAVAGVAGLMLALPALGGGAAEVRASVVDGALCLGACAGAIFVRAMPGGGRAALAGVALWLLLVGLGVALVQQEATARAAREAAPLLSAPLRSLGASAP